MLLIWFGITLGVFVGASRTLAFAGGGFSAGVVGEWAVTIPIYIGAALGISAMVEVLLGLYRTAFWQAR